MANLAGSKPFLRLAAPALFVVALFAAGCSTTIDNTDDVAAAPGRTGVPINTGTYPNLNIAPKVAAEQFSQEERDSKMAALDAARQQQAPASSGESAEARKKRLKLLADEHEADTLKVIESE